MNWAETYQDDLLSIAREADAIARIPVDVDEAKLLKATAGISLVETVNLIRAFGTAERSIEYLCADKRAQLCLRSAIPNAELQARIARIHLFPG